ncbi:MAG: phosphoadenosine phosphosulfate reductase family protein [Methanococci archaeon]|nr:phosphoadenosine phosphosulfate reductase family protein [Methanococci archaeon]
MKTYLGKIHLKWCKNCNVPLLGNKCEVCGSKAEKVKITPPGDPRLGFEYDIKFVNRILEETFGVKNIIDGKIILLNKLPGNEESYEIIVDGEVKYLIYFDENEEKWKPKLKLGGAFDLMEKGARKKIIKIKQDVVDILKNKKGCILRPGIIEYTDDINEKDDVIVVDENENVVGVGLAIISSKKIDEISRGKVIKVRSFIGKDNKIFSPKRSYKNLNEAFKVMVKANEGVISTYEKNSIGFIRNISQKLNKPVIVAFSGGKDSLTTLILTIKALGKNFEVVFVDTGLEFEETLKNVEEVEKKYDIKITRLKGENFWEKIKEYGIPARDYRWCSDVCKLNPLKTFIEEKYKEDVLSFVGIRKYESFNRAHKKVVYRNTYIKRQINALPIFHWSSLHVWIYLLREKAPYNKLYEKGFDRIGCFICPAMEMGEINKIKKEFKDLWDKWESVLIEYAKEHNLGEDWVKKGLWRWKHKIQEEKAS